MDTQDENEHESDRFDWLPRILLPGQHFEVRHALRSGGAASRLFLCNDAGLGRLRSYLGGPEGLESDDAIESIWFSPNPLRRDLTGTAKDADVLERRWLLIDCDPVRAEGFEGQSSTEDEKQAAWETACNIKDALASEGWLEPLVGDSGNGYHLLMPLALPNDDASRGKCQAFLREVAGRFNTNAVCVDTCNFNASRVVKLYGSVARKGASTPERPWRQSGAIVVPDGYDGAEGALAMERIMTRWRRSSELAGEITPAMKNVSHAPGSAQVVERARKYLQRADLAVSGNRGSDTCFRVACVLTHGFSLTDDEAFAAISDWNAACSPPWSEKELRHKFATARDHHGHQTPRGHLLTAPLASSPASAASAVGCATPGAEEEEEEEKLPESIDDVARAADLIAAGARITWAWPDWIAFGVLTVVAGEAGCGKTRLVLDLMRRVRHGLGWPDGQAIEIPTDSRWLYMMADDNHAEVAKVVTDWGMEEAFFVPATKNAPFDGTRLDGQIDRLRHYMRVVRPKFLVVDTVGSATMHKMHASDEVELLTRPLRQMAREFECAILGLTHLNASGGVLGRRVVEKARQVVMIAEPDRDNQPKRRSLWVDKSNADKPAALGVTMGHHGNEYDAEPPVSPENREPGKKHGAPRAQESATAIEDAWQWLRPLLVSGPRKVHEILTLGENATPAHSKGTLYRCLDLGRVERCKDGGKVAWRLPLDDHNADHEFESPIHSVFDDILPMNPTDGAIS